MTNATGLGKEVKLNAGYSAPKNESKEYAFHELIGLIKVFRAIRVANQKLPMNVDYWIAKNDKALGLEFNKYLKEEWDLIEANAEKKEVGGFTYIAYKGKDDNDVIYKGAIDFYRLEDDKMVLSEKNYWDLEVSPAVEASEGVEAKAAQVQPMQYVLKFPTDEIKDAWTKEMEKLQDGYKFHVSLWKLKEENLEGLNVMWQTKNEDLSVFRELLYENAIG